MQTEAINEQIQAFIRERFPLARKRNINNDDQLLESGILDSLGVLDLVAYLEQEFNISVADDELVPTNFQTIVHLTTFLQKKGVVRLG